MDNQQNRITGSSRTRGQPVLFYPFRRIIQLILECFFPLRFGRPVFRPFQHIAGHSQFPVVGIEQTPIHAGALDVEAGSLLPEHFIACFLLQQLPNHFTCDFIQRDFLAFPELPRFYLRFSIGNHFMELEADSGMVVPQGAILCLLNDLQFGQQILIAAEQDSQPVRKMIAELTRCTAHICQINAAVREQKTLQALRSLNQLLAASGR
ncbi:hypothetical protein D3C73_760230 [compost metagenome]